MFSTQLSIRRRARASHPTPNSAFAPYGTAFGAGDIIGATLDRSQHTIRFSVNGTDFGVAFELPEHMHGAGNLHPAITLKGTAARINLGQTPFHRFSTSPTAPRPLASSAASTPRRWRWRR